jgi:hypothetical protein
MARPLARHGLTVLIPEPPRISRPGTRGREALDFPSWPGSQDGGRTSPGASEHTSAGGQGFSAFADGWRPRCYPPRIPATAGFRFGVRRPFPDGCRRRRRAGATRGEAIWRRSRPRPSWARGRKACQLSLAYWTASPSRVLGFRLENQTKAAKWAATSRGSIGSPVESRFEEEGASNERKPGASLERRALLLSARWGSLSKRLGSKLYAKQSVFDLGRGYAELDPWRSGVRQPNKAPRKGACGTSSGAVSRAGASKMFSPPAPCWRHASAGGGACCESQPW